MGILRSKLNELARADGELVEDQELAASDDGAVAQTTETAETTQEAADAEAPSEEPLPNLSSLAKTSRKKRKGRRSKTPKRMTLADIEARTGETATSRDTEDTILLPVPELELDAAVETVTDSETTTALEPLGAPDTTCEEEMSTACEAPMIPETTTPDTPAAGLEGAGGLAQVRDLLVGADLTNFRGRIEMLETLCAEQGELITAMQAAIDTLQASNDALAERINTETQARVALGEELKGRLSNVESELTSTEERLRSEVVAQGTVLSGLVQQRHDEACEAMRQGFDALEADKTSRADLATVLETAAKTLRKAA